MPKAPGQRNDMSLKSRLRAPASVPHGFQFAQPGFLTFSQLGEFRQELRSQAAATSLIDATDLIAVGLDGHVLGIEENKLRLTRVAFGQLCHLCALPRAYVDSLARRNESLAVEVVSEALVSMLHRNETKVMVVDNRSNVVHAIIDRDSYNLVSNETVLDLALSASPHASLSRGFVDGPNVRITVTDPNDTTEPQVGDIVRIGTDLTTHLGEESFLKASAYNERLRCMNGMTVRDRAYVETLGARRDVASELPEVLLRTVRRGKLVGPLMKRSAQIFLDEKGIDAMIDELSDPSKGGSTSLLKEVTEGAVSEARHDDREDCELSVWDFVNGLTSAAKNARTLNRRIVLEGKGYQVMAKFVGIYD